MFRKPSLIFASALLGSACVVIPPSANVEDADTELEDASLNETGVSTDTDVGTTDTGTADADDTRNDIATGTTREESEPNDSDANANPAALGDTLTGQADLEDGDWWQFTIPEAPTILRIDQVRFYDPLDGSTRGDDVVISLTPKDQSIDRRIYVADEGLQRRFFIASAGEYLLNVGVDSDEPGYEMRIALDELPPIVAGEATRPGDLSDLWPDIYRYDPPAASPVGVTLEADDSSSYDPLLIVYKPGSGLVAHDDDGGDGDNAALEFTVGTTDPVWVVATGFSMPADGTEYLLTWSP